MGVGTARCGTSWWCANLFAHPAVSRARGAPKETHYFDRFEHLEFRDTDVEPYHRYFPRRPGTLAGEWTPTYIYDEAAMGRLHGSAPSARVLVLLRDPVERFWSAVHFDTWWAARRGVPPRPDLWLGRGAYLRGLEGAARTVGRERLLVLQYERCLLDTGAELRRTYEFVGVDPDFVPPDLTRLHAQGSGDPKRSMPADTREMMVEFYRPHVMRLVSAWPEIDLGLWPNFRDLA